MPKLFRKKTPVLPYDGTSGWSGSDTSRDRAIGDDSSGVTGHRQQAVMSLLAARGTLGATWAEVATDLGIHHGSASGALSVLHLAGHIVRLQEKRDRRKVYVLPEFVNGRDTETHGRKKPTCPHCGEQL